MNYVHRNNLIKGRFMMEKVSTFKGISGQLGAFKKEVASAENVVFAGVPGVCTPFAQLLAYAIRDKKTYFIPNTEIENARKMKLTDYGIELGSLSQFEADVMVILGGLAMPRIGSEISAVQELIKKSVNNECSIIGVCFMDIFRKSSWDHKIKFDSIINVDMEGYVLE